MLRDGDQAYSVELSADDPLAVQYQLEKRAYDEAPLEQHGGATEIRRPFWQVTTLPVGESGEKLYRKVMHSAEFTHWPDSTRTHVVDDMLKNERASGSF
jgi:hypothetical protein